MINLHNFGIPLEHLVGFEFKEKMDTCKVKYSIISYTFPSRGLATPALRGLTQIEYYSQQCEVEGDNNCYTLLLNPEGNDVIMASSFNRKHKVTETVIRQKLDHSLLLMNTLLHPEQKKLYSLARDYLTRAKDSYRDLFMREGKNVRGFEAAVEGYRSWKISHPLRLFEEALEIYGWVTTTLKELDKADQSPTLREGIVKVVDTLRSAQVLQTLSGIPSNIMAEEYRGIRSSRNSKKLSMSKKEREELLRTGVQQIAHYFYGNFNNSTIFKDRVDQRLKDYVDTIKKP